MRLFTYFRSGAAWRVRIGLALKGVASDAVPIDLRTGAQTLPGWTARNPQGLIPALELEDGTLLTQSLAILEWLEECYPQPSLFPEGAIARARVRAVALAIAADTHPVQNLRVLKRVEALAGADAARQWGHDTVAGGLAAVEAMIADGPGPYAFGASPTLADLCIVPQLANAGRFGVDLQPFARIRAIATAADGHPAFAAARPEAQPDWDG